MKEIFFVLCAFTPYLIAFLIVFSIYVLIYLFFDIYGKIKDKDKEEILFKKIFLNITIILFLLILDCSFYKFYTKKMEKVDKDFVSFLYCYRENNFELFSKDNF